MPSKCEFVYFAFCRRLSLVAWMLVYFHKYSEKARGVLNALLDKYADEGIENIEDINDLKVQPFDKIGTPMEIVKLFGNKQKYLEALQEGLLKYLKK